MNGDQSNSPPYARNCWSRHCQGRVRDYSNLGLNQWLIDGSMRTGHAQTTPQTYWVSKIAGCCYKIKKVN